MKKIPFIVMSAVMLVLSYASTANAAGYYTITQVRKDTWVSTSTSYNQYGYTLTDARDRLRNAMPGGMNCVNNSNSQITCTTSSAYYFWSSYGGCSTAANGHGSCSTVNGYLNQVNCSGGYALKNGRCEMNCPNNNVGYTVSNGSCVKWNTLSDSGCPSTHDRSSDGNSCTLKSAYRSR